MLAAVISCQRHEADIRLQNIAGLCGSDPAAALDSLRAIERTLLSEPDQDLYDFLEIKASDKAYIRHTSDSLILKVVEYESRHKSNGRYAEALYYAGRVYSDLGDYPQAIRYFQDALDAIGESDDNLDVRANIASQNGRLLTNIGLYDEAIPYINKSLDIDKKLNDSINLINDLQLLACVYMKSGDYEKSQSIFRETLSLAKDSYSPLRGKSMMYLAYIKSILDEPDSAIYYIRDVPFKVPGSIHDYALGIAADIYLKAGINDTAFRYAHQLIGSSDSILQEKGYNILLNHRLNQCIPIDTLLTYLDDYHSLLSKRFNSNGMQLTITQQTKYNYQTHVRKKEQVSRKLDQMKFWITGSVIVILVIITIILIVYCRAKATIIRLQKSLMNIKELNYNQSNRTVCSSEKDLSNPESIPKTFKNLISENEYENQSTQDLTKDVLRKQLQNELISLYKKTSSKREVEDSILHSDIYWNFKTKAEKGVLVNIDDSLWLDLEQMVLSVSPKFRSNLLLLLSDKITPSELHTALLIKCGFRPSEMMALLGKSNGAIVSRRDHLGTRAFDQKLKADMISSIIRSL